MQIVELTRHVRASYAVFGLYRPAWLLCVRLCCAPNKHCAVCLHLSCDGIWSRFHMPSVTVILFEKRFFEFWEIVACQCNFSLVKMFRNCNYNFTSTKNLN